MLLFATICGIKARTREYMVELLTCTMIAHQASTIWRIRLALHNTNRKIIRFRSIIERAFLCERALVFTGTIFRRLLPCWAPFRGARKMICEKSPAKMRITISISNTTAVRRWSPFTGQSVVQELSLQVTLYVGIVNYWYSRLISTM